MHVVTQSPAEGRGCCSLEEKRTPLGWSPGVGTSPPALKYGAVVVARMNFCPLTVSTLSYLAIFSLYTVKYEQIRERGNSLQTWNNSSSFYA